MFENFLYQITQFGDVTFTSKFMKFFQTPKGRAGMDQLDGIQESISSHLERMFLQSAKRNLLQYELGNTTSTTEGNNRKMQLYIKQRGCNAAIMFHAGRSVELSMQLIYAFGTDRIMGRENPKVKKSEITRDRRSHSLNDLRERILKDLPDRDLESALEDAYQIALNQGLLNVLVDGSPSCLVFETVEDAPFREMTTNYIADGLELTADHIEFKDLLFYRSVRSEFSKMSIDTFPEFLSKADKSYYETSNLRWSDYSARDHEHGRPYVVVGINFFARLVRELVKLANQQWIWDDNLALRWWGRRKHRIRSLLDNHAKQNFREQIEFPEMIPPEEDMKRYREIYDDPDEKIKLGYERFRRQWEIPTLD